MVNRYFILHVCTRFEDEQPNSYDNVRLEETAVLRVVTARVCLLDEETEEHFMAHILVREWSCGWLHDELLVDDSNYRLALRKADFLRTLPASD